MATSSWTTAKCLAFDHSVICLEVLSNDFNPGSICQKLRPLALSFDYIVRRGFKIYCTRSAVAADSIKEEQGKCENSQMIKLQKLSICTVENTVLAEVLN